jgi:hypothetical protein
MARCALAAAALALVAGPAAAQDGEGSGGRTAKSRPAEKIAVFPFEAVNVAPGVVRAASAVLESELRKRGFTVAEWELEVSEPPEPEPEPEPEPGPTEPVSAPPIHPPPPPPIAPAAPVALAPPAPELSTVQKREIARDIGCDFYLDGSLVKLGSEIRVAVFKRDLDGAVVDSREMPAGNDDDLVTVLERIAQAFAERKTVDQTLDLDNATRAEARDLPERFRLEKNFGAIIGQAFGVGDSMHYFTILAFDARLEIGDAMVELSAGFAPGESESTQMMIDIGAAYYLTHTRIAPYLGAGAGVFFGDRIEAGGGGEPSPSGLDGGDDEFAVGFEAFPVLGLEFLRHSSIRLHLDFRYSFSWSPDGDFGHGPVALVGINF